MLQSKHPKFVNPGFAQTARLCRYITRPALANDRVKINGQGQVELKLKTP
jgi:Putative transposase